MARIAVIGAGMGAMAAAARLAVAGHRVVGGAPGGPPGGRGRGPAPRHPIVSREERRRSSSAEHRTGLVTLAAMPTAAPPRRRLRATPHRPHRARHRRGGGAIFGNGDQSIPDRPVGVLTGSDPFAYSEAKRATFERRAAAGYSHVVYAKSPGGVVATARRTERYRPVIRRGPAQQGFDPDILEAIVFLESAGRPEAKADPKLEGAVGSPRSSPRPAAGCWG